MKAADEVACEKTHVNGANPTSKIPISATPMSSAPHVSLTLCSAPPDTRRCGGRQANQRAEEDPALSLSGTQSTWSRR